MDQNREVVAEDVLAQVAEGTGGEFFHNNNDLKAGFGRLAGSPGSYILAFAPKDLKPDGKFHQLKVTLAEKEPAYSIQARRGYFAPRNEAEAKAGAKEVEASSAADQVQEQMREALLSKTEIAQFPVVLDAKVSEGQGETHELSLLSHVDPQSLHFQKEGDHNLDTLTFIFGVFDQKENLVIAQQRHATVDVADGQLPEFLKAGMNVDMAFQLKPGSYRIREVVTDSEQRLTALSRNVDIPKIIPATPAASATPPPPAQAPAPQPGQPNPQGSAFANSDRAAGGAGEFPSAVLAIANSATGSPITSPDTASGARSQLPIRPPTSFSSACGTTLSNPYPPSPTSSPMSMWSPAVSAPYSDPSKSGVYDSELESTIDSTIDSIFRLKRFSADGKTADLVESREIKYVDHHAAAKGQSLAGPAILVGAFTRAPNVFSPEFKDCYEYRLLPNMRHKPGDAILFLHADVLVLEYALRSPLPAGIQCPVREQTTGRAFIDPSSMQIVRLEQQWPRRHNEGSKFPVSWSWYIDYARVMMDGKPFWLPRTISSKASSLDGGRYKWSFLATYSNYHLMTVTSTILPAANSSQH